VKPVEQAFLRIMKQMKQKRPEHRVTRALNDIMPKKKNEEKEQEDRTGVVRHQIYEYAHAILLQANSSGGDKMEEEEDTQVDQVKLIHLLGFLSKALCNAACFSTSERLSLGEDCVKLALSQITSMQKLGGSFTKVSNMLSKAMLMSATLSSLHASLESSEGEQEGEGEQERDFAARVLASLLQHKLQFPSSDASANNGQAAVMAECYILYGRCIVSSTEKLFSLATSTKSVQIGIKLLPLSISSLLQLVDSPYDMSAKTVSSEMTTLIRSVFSVPLSKMLLQSNNNSDAKDCIEKSLSALQRILVQSSHFKYHYEYLLPTLSSFLLVLLKSLKDKKHKDSKIHAQVKEWIAPTLEQLIQLHASPTMDASSKKSIEFVCSSVVEEVGCQEFLEMISLYNPTDTAALNAKKEDVVLSNDRAWILPIIKSSSSLTLNIPMNLSYFQSHVLAMARKMDAKTSGGGGGNKKKTRAEKAIYQSRVIELWSLFACFVGKPVDLEVSFMGVAGILVKAMGDSRYPQLVSIICTGLNALASGVLKRAEENENNDDADNNATSDPQADLDILSNVSTKLLPALFRMVENLHGTSTNPTDAAASKKSEKGDGGMDTDEEDDDEEKKSKQGLSPQDAMRVQSVIDAIAQLAKCCPRPFLQNLFKKVTQRLLLATQSSASDDGDDNEKNKNSEETDKICSLLGLAQALVSSQCLDENSISLLYRAVRPLVRTDEHNPSVQKKSYKVLVELCEKYTSFVTSDERLNEMTELMIGSIVTCQVSARHMRLKCVMFVVKGLDASNESHMEIVPKIMGEVLLCLKDSNGKTREAAYQLLLTMAENRGDMEDFFRIVLAALGAQTPHMRSAAVMGLSRLVFEYARTDEVVQTILPSVLQTVVVLFNEKTREVIKSVVAFVRVSVAAMSPEQLEPLLPQVVGGLMKFSRGKDRFRAKIKIILKKLVRTYGYDVITPLVPEDDARLITHMRKLSERAARRKAANRPDGQPDDKTNDFDELMESDEDDSDDGRTLMTGMTKFTQMTARSGKSIRSAATERSERTGMKSVAGRSMVSSKTAATMATASGPRIKAEKGGEILDMLDPSMAKSVHFADEGGDSEFSDDGDDAMEFDDVGRLVIHDENEGKSGGNAHDDGDDDAENDEIKAGGKRQRLSKFESAKVAKAEANVKRSQKKQRSNVKELGAAYKSKKAGGDVQKKGQKYEPYAYVPLDGKSYTKKNRRTAVEQMSTVVKRKGEKRKR